MSLKTTARAYLRDAVNSLRSSPLEVAVAIFTAVCLSYAIQNEPGDNRMEAWVQIAIAAFMVFAVAWAATLLHALAALDNRQRWELSCAGAVAAIAYLLTIDTIQLESEGWRAFMLVGGVVLLVLAAPAWRARADESNLRLRRINGRFALRAIGIALYGLALFGGLALALAAIDKLFELELDERIYAHTFGWIMLVLVPWVIVGGLRDYTAPIDEESDVARVVHRLTAFLIPPLLVLYYLILFVYALRMVITRELPKNLVSPMVLAAGLLTALAAILFDPAPNDQRTSYRVLRFAPAIFIPLVPLGFWALYARIDEYGWTEFRLLRVIALAALFVLAILATLQLVQRRHFSLRVVPVLFGAILLIGAVGPWSVLRIAREDQQQRLAAALRAANVDTARVPTDTTQRVVSRTVFQRINDTGYYLQSHFGDDAVKEVAGANAANFWIRWSLTDYFRLMVAQTDTTPWVTHGQLPLATAVPLVEGSAYRIRSPSPNIQMRGSEIIVNVAGERLRGDLDTLIARLPRGGMHGRRAQHDLPNITVGIYDANNQRRGEIVLLAATVQVWRDSVQVSISDGLLILQ